MSKKLTNEEFQKKLDETFSQKILLIDNYVNKRTEVTLQCQECNYVWKNKPHNLYGNWKHHCPNCGVSKKIEFKCAYCGKSIYRAPSDIKENKSGYFYCSHTCGNLHKNQIRKESGEWENTNNYRLKAFEYYEHKCAVCGWNEDERVLQVHHLDENRKNNSKENLCILCPTCHWKITLHLYELTKNYTLIPIEEI